MSPTEEEHKKICHVMAMPYPGRGHINPLMNLCTLLTSRQPNLLITFVVTQEWLGLLGSNNKPKNVNFATLPNVIPSEQVRGKDFTAFFEAVSTKLEDPFQHLISRLELQHPVSVILADVFLVWAAGFGNRTNIPVALFWPMSASMFSIVHHFDLVVKNHHYPLKSSDKKTALVDYIPGIAITSLADIPFLSDPIAGHAVLQRVLECISQVPKAQFLLHSSVYNLESHAIDTIKAAFPFPVYPVGPVIPHFHLGQNPDTCDYIEWLDSRPPASILYISLGSFLSTSSAQMDEIVAGVLDSGVQFLWVARGECSWLKDSCGNKGTVVPWCNQLEVLCHSSVGGFWTHCGWNSTVEGVYAGVPMLTFPLFSDQLPNSKQIVEDWRIGWRLRRELTGEDMIKRGEIAETVRSFMDPENNEIAEMRNRAKRFKEECLRAVGKGGSSVANIDAFISGIL